MRTMFLMVVLLMGLIVTGQVSNTNIFEIYNRE